MPYIHPAALEYERKRWLRHDAYRFIRPDWRRYVQPGSTLAATYEYIERKYRADQPRVPRGNPDGGRWTTGGGGGQTASSARTQNEITRPRTNVAPVQYSPSKEGYHHYQAGPNVVCPADRQCSREEMADQLARYSVPGQDPAKPVENGHTYAVHDPNTGLYVGKVRTLVSADGLTITNKTQEGHIFHDGKITRRAIQAADGSWRVTTEGIGNNVIPGMNVVNQTFGPGIFDGLDRQMRVNIERHHTKGHNVAHERGAYARYYSAFRLGMGS